VGDHAANSARNQGSGTRAGSTGVGDHSRNSAREQGPCTQTVKTTVFADSGLCVDHSFGKQMDRWCVRFCSTLHNGDERRRKDAWRGRTVGGGRIECSHLLGVGDMDVKTCWKAWSQR
jgi:hypothetical protein